MSHDPVFLRNSQKQDIFTAIGLDIFFAFYQGFPTSHFPSCWEVLEGHGSFGIWLKDKLTGRYI